MCFGYFCLGPLVGCRLIRFLVFGSGSSESCACDVSEWPVFSGSRRIRLDGGGSWGAFRLRVLVTTWLYLRLLRVMFVRFTGCEKPK